VRRSLAQRRLLLLDALPSEQLVIEAVGLRRNPELIRRLGEEATENWRSLRDVVLGKPVDETRYNLLEEAATGVHELVGAPREGRGLRVRPLGRLVPSRSGTVDAIPAAPATREDVAAARTREEAFRAELAERYLYELVLRNCVTEIEALVAAEDPDFEVDSLLAFAPFELAREARASRVAGGSADLPSHRQRRVSEMAAREGRIRVALRESNVWTATAYEGSITDDPFLFFADGSPWLRPPLGVTNLFYGLGHAAFGLVRAPFDRGRLAFRGLRGAFYSVPEVFGVSIRKGRYDLLPRGAAPAPLLRAELEGRVR
jgi:hypothetical protein